MSSKKFCHFFNPDPAISGTDPGISLIHTVFLNKSKLLQKISTSLQNRRHFSIKNNTRNIVVIYK